jgi:phosphatidylglycerol:prolipoprotein diacylglycerol transferase
MLVHPGFDPIALKLGPLAVRWYGLMYLMAFIGVILLGRYRIKTRPNSGWSIQMLDDILFFGVLGVVLGGRLGYVLFYKPDYYFSHLLEIFYVWEGGMSFHGGFLGVLIAMWLYSRRVGLSWLMIMDFIAPLTPLGLAFGRIGNFINAELWGRATDLPWAMVFPTTDPTLTPRHPSQLYEFGLEGVALFILVWWYSSRPRPTGAVSAVFLIGYGAFRFIAEFAREPDAFLGYLALHLSMGQWLSLPMILVGIWMLRWSHARRH